jgi:hypothetical protein
MNTTKAPSIKDSRLISVFTFATVAVCGLATGIMPGVAEAKWARTHASACMSVNSTVHPTDTAYAVWNDSIIQDMTLLCALPDTDRFAKTAFKTLNIHGKDGSSSRNVDAMVCRSNWATTGGGCSAIVSSPTGTPHYTLQPNLSVLSGRTADFGYVWVRLPPKVGASRSGLRGFYTAD